MARASRRMKPRRVVLHDLKVTRDFLTMVSNKWNVTSRVWRSDADGGTRARAANEYPENQPETWRKLQDELNTAITVLSELRDYAREQEAISRAAQN